jgi:hypothetical protein
MGEMQLFNESLTFPIMKEFLSKYALQTKRPGLQPRKTSPYLELFTEEQF